MIGFFVIPFESYQIFFILGGLRNYRFLQLKVIDLCFGVFKPTFPEILERFVLRDLVCYFSLERPLIPSYPPSCNLNVVLRVFRRISL